MKRIEGEKKEKELKLQDEKSQAENRSPEKRRNATAFSIRQAGRLPQRGNRRGARILVQKV
jgi:hypothetical protein